MIDRDELKANLRNQDAKVTFTKVDGTERVMRCTLRDDALPVSESTTTTSRSPDVLSVWDLDKSAWRSFRFDSVKDVKFC
jgi:hypothetical protein